jgi:nucleotide-binding universal stress UspA family protein
MKRLLVCSDGSEYSQVCYQYADWLAGRTGASIDVLYLTDIRQFEVPLIADLSGSLGIQPYQDVMSQLQEIEKEKAALIEATCRKILTERDQDGGVSVHHHTGLLVDCLEDYEADVDLVMLGKRGENADFASEHIGSTAERVIRASKKPCLVTSRAFMPIKKIVLAYDGGQSCRKAAEFLASSNAFKELELHIVSVVEDKDKPAAEKFLESAAETVRAGGYEPVCEVLEGEVEAAIAGYVESEGMELLVMGAYGHNRIRYLLIGSSTTEMIRSCHIPVLCFR